MVVPEALIRLYVMPLPVGAVMVMVPPVLQVGWAVTEPVGCSGTEGGAFTTRPVRAVEEPQVFCAVTE